MAAEGGRGRLGDRVLSGAAAGALLAGAVLALADWAAVAARRQALEAILKPAVMVALIAGLETGRPAHPEERPWFALALLLSLAGDVFLLPQVDRFRSGLSAFLLGHLAYLAGFRRAAFHPEALWVAAPVLILAALALLPRILRSAPAGLQAPISLYALTILAMVGAAAGTRQPAAIAGAALFLVSDGLLAWGRFVGELPRGRLLVIVTYHLAQGLLTASILV